MGEGFPADIAARLFRALFDDWDLHEVRGAWVAVPKGTPWLAGPTLHDVSRQIAGHGLGTSQPVTGRAAAGQPHR